MFYFMRNSLIHKDGFIIMSEYFNPILECLKKNGPSVYREIANCVYLKINHNFRREDTAKHLGNRSEYVWEHQISEALFTLKKKGIIRLRSDKRYEII